MSGGTLFTGGHYSLRHRFHETRTEKTYGNPRPEQYPDSMVSSQAGTSWCSYRQTESMGPLAVAILSPCTVKILIRETIFMSLIMAIGSESVKIKSQKLSQMNFRGNFTPWNFLAIWYLCVAIVAACSGSPPQCSTFSSSTYYTSSVSLASHTLDRERKGLVTLQLLSCRRGT